MEENMKLGMNKTGVDMSPIQTQRMIEGTEQFMPAGTAEGNYPVFATRFYAESDHGLGSVPLPGTLRGVVKSTTKMLTGKHPEVFINKLGERLAYERSGVRIYDQLILKCQRSEGLSALVKPSLAQLEEFRNEEMEHFLLLVESLEMLGADPTAQTPDADASAVATQGLLKVITDPRTSISQSLEAMLSIELTDNAAWQLLIKLADDMDLQDMADKFRHALKQEDIHLATVKSWYEDTVRSQDQ